MSLNEYPIGTPNRDKILDTLKLSVIVSNNPAYKELLQLSDANIDEVLKLFNKVVLDSINSAISLGVPFRMHKFATLKIKEGNKLAYKIKDNLAREAGYESYLDVPRSERAKLRDKTTTRVQQEKMQLKKNAIKIQSSPKLTLDVNKINNIRKKST